MAGASDWNTVPAQASAATRRATTSNPAAPARPAKGRTCPVRSGATVVLPAPLVTGSMATRPGGGEMDGASGARGPQGPQRAVAPAASMPSPPRSAPVAVTGGTPRPRGIVRRRPSGWASASSCR